MNDLINLFLTWFVLSFAFAALGMSSGAFSGFVLIRAFGNGKRVTTFAVYAASVQVFFPLIGVTFATLPHLTALWSSNVETFTMLFLNVYVMAAVCFGWVAFVKLMTRFIKSGT